MNKWKVAYTNKASSDFLVIDRPVRRQIIDRLEWFAAHFDELTPAPLHSDWKGFFKFRIGDWRIIYTFDSPVRLITVHQVDRRDKVYKKRR